MHEYYRLARLLDTVYVLSVFVQLLLTVVAIAGCVLLIPRLSIRQGPDNLTAVLLVVGWGGFLMCWLLRVVIKRWFRRRWPLR